MSDSERTSGHVTSARTASMRKVYLKREFKLEKETHYPLSERLFRQMGEERYLRELRNPFDFIMGNEFPEFMWKGWDALLLTRASEERVQIQHHRWNADLGTLEVGVR
jgi:hypothetical protein